MQSNLNNSNENNKNINENIIDELLLKNQEIFNLLILENVNRKEKSLISTNEYEYLRNYEKNLIQLIEHCPINKLSEIMDEINPKEPSIEEEEDQKIEDIKGKKEEQEK